MSDITKKYKSSTHYLLASLIPYTEANIKLAFIPKHFFADLAKLDRAKEKNLRTAYYRAVKQGLIEIDDQGLPHITSKGLAKLAPYQSKTLADSMIMIIFDIPETQRNKRDQLRLLLKELQFQQTQKSVWLSRLDSRKYLGEEIKRLNLSEYVEIYEVKKL